MRLVELVNDRPRWWSFRKHGVILLTKPMTTTTTDQNREQCPFRTNNKMKCLDIEIIFIRAFVAVISLLGCIWHLADISTIYFSYDTNVNVRFEHEVPVRVPGVTICTNASLTIREDYMAERYPQLRAALRDRQVSGLHNLTNVISLCYVRNIRCSRLCCVLILPRPLTLSRRASTTNWTNYSRT